MKKGKCGSKSKAKAPAKPKRGQRAGKNKMKKVRSGGY